ncbi:MAG: hypothetical protein HOI76_02430, partial [Microbacteriaceae bacterium]|nr:hypothetical protein [Microbacteriaceae bacterium]
LAGIAPAPTAETLMRSRYSAYVLERSDYIRSTWHPATCPNALNPEPGLHWLGLKIKRVEDGLEQDDHGIVEFVARSKRDGRAQRLHETSSSSSSIDASTHNLCVDARFDCLG